MAKITANLAADYPVILGAGGFGVVKTGNRPPFNQFAVKFITPNYCKKY